MQRSIYLPPAESDHRSDSAIDEGMMKEQLKLMMAESCANITSNLYFYSIRSKEINGRIAEIPHDWPLLINEAGTTVRTCKCV